MTPAALASSITRHGNRNPTAKENRIYEADTENRNGRSAAVDCTCTIYAEGTLCSKRDWKTLLRRTSALIVSAPPNLFIRTADAVHLVTAHEVGEREVWTNDRHVFASASYFGLVDRSV
jgi:predicted nucleic acid-binding protein